MSSTAYFNFNVTAQYYLAAAVNTLAMGYYVTWEVIDAGDAQYTVMNLVYPLPNRKVRILFPRSGKPVLDVSMNTPDSSGLALKYGAMALATVIAEAERWLTRGTNMEEGSWV